MGFNAGSTWWLNGNVTWGGGVLNADGASIVGYLNDSGYAYGVTASLQTGAFQASYFNMAGFTSDYYDTSDEAKSAIVGALTDAGYQVSVGYWRITDPVTGADHQDQTQGVSSIFDSIVKAVFGQSGGGAGAGGPGVGSPSYVTLILVAAAIFVLPSFLSGLGGGGGGSSGGSRRRRR